MYFVRHADYYIRDYFYFFSLSSAYLLPSLSEIDRNDVQTVLIFS